MRKPEDILKVRQITHNKHITVQVNKLAEALAFALYIPCDKSNLVLFLGDGDERNNLFALRTWVRIRLSEKKGLSEHKFYRALEVKLLNHLEEVRNNVCV